ncbi:MAG: DUF4760 domain-containing protein [Acidobacteriia bacterium]|nr:DUF4760 domain-containing protein [Terriglobia bacterium]
MRIEIPNRYVVVGAFLLVEAGFLLWFNTATERRRATIAFAGTVTAAAFALHTYLGGIEERRANNAQGLIERWNSPSMVSVREVLRQITENRLDPTVLERKAKGDLDPDADVENKRASLVTVLNFYEELAIASLHKSANEERLYAFFSGIISQSATRLEGWIKHERAIDNEPDYYCEFLELAARWAALRR